MHVGDVAAQDLAKALDVGSEYVQRLRSLELQASCLHRAGAEHLVAAVVAHCPSLWSFKLDAKYLTRADQDALRGFVRAVKGEKLGLLDVWGDGDVLDNDNYSEDEDGFSDDYGDD